MFIVRGSRSRFTCYKKELIALLSGVGVLFLSLSLFSYNPQDSSWFFYSSQIKSVSNWCGTVGAHMASLFIYLFGMAAWVIIPMLAFVAYTFAMQKSVREEWERLVACIGLLLSVAALCSFHGFDLYRTAIPGGGYIGYAVATLSYNLFDWLGSALFLYTMMYLCMVLLFRFSGMYLVQYGLHAITATYQRFIAPHVRACASFIRGKIHSFILQPAANAGRNMWKLITQPAQSENVIYQEEPTMFVPAEAESNSVTGDEIQENIGIAEDSLSEQMYGIEMQGEPGIDTAIDSGFGDLPAQEVHSDQQKSYGLPSLDIFIGVEDKRDDVTYKSELEQRARILEEKLERFGVYGNVVSIKSGPVVTLFEYQPQIDTKLSKILALEDDLALALQAMSIRIIAPIPGRSVVGFEVANKNRKDVLLSRAIQSDEYKNFEGALPLILGEDTIGSTVIVDLARMPHLLIAGSTGSGKSVALNTMLISLLCKYSPEELKLILIDPKRLEFASYADIAHLLFPIVTDPKRSAPILRWVIKQMETRYEKMALLGARNIFDYNKIVARQGEEKLPFIVVVIDELSDLMLTVGREIEDLITRITQMARAAGIHMIVATQRPSVDVITGLIKVNFPSRVSFRVTSKGDSRTILDCGGADKLLGRGDMLFLDSTASVLRRVHGAYVTSREIDQVVAHIHAQQDVEYLDVSQELSTHEADISQEDEILFKHVLGYLQEVDEISISLLQRRFRIGYNRSARIIDMLEAQGLIMPADGGKTRRVIR